MTPVGWLLLAAALLLLPTCTPAPAAPDRAPPPDAPHAATRLAQAAAGRAGVAVAIAGTALTCVAALGASHGGVVAMVAAPFAGALVRHAQRRPAQVDADPALPLVLDLVAAALRSGRPLPTALALAAPAGRADTAAELDRVAALCRLGADPAEAWAGVPRAGPLGPLVPVAVRSATSGSKLAAAFERLAVELRAERTAAAAIRAHRAGVHALAPLGGCFLPSFVCLGVIPVVVGVARTSLGVLR